MKGQKIPLALLGLRQFLCFLACSCFCFGEENSDCDLALVEGVRNFSWSMFGVPGPEVRLLLRLAVKQEATPLRQSPQMVCGLNSGRFLQICQKHFCFSFLCYIHLKIRKCPTMLTPEAVKQLWETSKKNNNNHHQGTTNPAKCSQFPAITSPTGNSLHQSRPFPVSGQSGNFRNDGPQGLRFCSALYKAKAGKLPKRPFNLRLMG